MFYAVEIVDMLLASYFLFKISTPECSSGEVIAVVGSCESLGIWSYQKAVVLKALSDEGFVITWFCNSTKAQKIFFVCILTAMSPPLASPEISG